MNPPPIDGSRISTYFGPLFARQLDHGLVRKFVDYVTFINAFVLICQCYNYLFSKQKDPNQTDSLANL